MALVKIEEFQGTIVGNAVYETLELVGLINALNIRQYKFSIQGVQDATPDGMIDDEPKCHVIIIEKIKFIGKSKDLPFIKGREKDKQSPYYPIIMDEMNKTDLKFGIILGIPRNEKKHITLDKDGVWYRHTLEITIKQRDMSTEEYVKYIFSSIADMIVKYN